jgi:microcystin degradation protein MlrC
MTPLMIENATAIVLEKEYPHTDFAERADEVFTIIADTLAGKVKPHTALFDCRMIGIYQTTRPPMRQFVDRIMAQEGKDGVLSISVVHGFPWGDVPNMGTKILVITDNQPEKGAALAEQLGREMFDLRFELRPHYLTIDEALAKALAVVPQPGKPVVIADVTDNPGGGTPGDSTFLLRALIERGITNVALGIMYDPIMVALAQDAGEGAVLDLRIGGKMGVTSGDAVDLTAEVLKVGELTQHFGIGSSLIPMEMGLCAAIRAHGIDIVLTSRRQQVYGTDFFTNMGIDLTQKRFVVVKSSQHFYAAFAPIASEVIYCAPPGTLQTDLARVAYKRIDMNKFPLVDDPFDK